MQKDNERRIDALKSASSKAIEAINSVRRQRPTDYEKIIQAFEANNFQPIELGELVKIIWGERAEGWSPRDMQFKIAKLRRKLTPHGINIRRSSSYSLELGSGKDSD